MVRLVTFLGGLAMMLFGLVLTLDLLSLRELAENTGIRQATALTWAAHAVVQHEGAQLLEAGLALGGLTLMVWSGWPGLRRLVPLPRHRVLPRQSYGARLFGLALPAVIIAVAGVQAGRAFTLSQPVLERPVEDLLLSDPTESIADSSRVEFAASSDLLSVPLGQAEPSSAATITGSLQLASTYESISVYAPFTQDENQNNFASLRWRRVGDLPWKDGMAMTVDRRPIVGGPKEKPIPNPFINQWRASVLGLSPSQEYEIEVTFADPDGVSGTNPMTQTVATRSDSYPSNGTFFFVDPGGSDDNPGSPDAPFRTIQRGVDRARAGDTVLVNAGTYYEQVTVAHSGSVDGYITVSNVGSERPIIDAAANANSCGTGAGEDASCAFLIKSSYVRLSGFEIANARIGIKVQSPAHDVILDNNYIRDVVFLGGPSVPILIGNTSEPNEVTNVTISENTVVAAPGDPAGQAIRFLGTLGGHVVRNNQITFTHHGTRGVHGSDCIGGIPNQGIQGLGHDNDIYGNVCIGATDDGIELDGSGMNNRLWGNTIVGSNLGLSIAPVDIGPAYIFRNVIYDLQIHWTRSCTGVKTGESGTGSVYFYHNTFYLADPKEACIFGSNRRSRAVASAGGGRDSENVVFVNNIFHGFDRSISSAEEITPTLDYNIHYAEVQRGIILQYGRRGNFRSFPDFQAATGQETNGSYGRPTYVDEDNGDFRLANDSPGIDAGAVLVGFNDENSPWPYAGAAPDIGAFEFFPD